MTAETRPSAIARCGLEPEHAHRAGVGRRQAEQHVDRGGLAGAVGAEEGDDLAGRDGQVDAVDGTHAAEGLVQAPQVDRQRAASPAGAGVGRVSVKVMTRS